MILVPPPGRCPTPEPVDPMQAALDARRNRNTGPKQLSRARKNIGWGRQ